MPKFPRRALPLCVLVAIAAAACTSSPDTGTIRGTVTRAGGDPIAGVEVSVVDATSSEAVASATTSAAGDFSVNVDDGSFRVGFESPDGKWTSEWYDGRTDAAAADVVDVEAGATVTIDPVLQARSVVSAVAVVDTVPEQRPMGAGVVEIRRTGDLETSLDVEYTTRYSTARFQSDYVHPGEGAPSGGSGDSSVVTIPAGEEAASLTFAIEDDQIPEATETIVVMLGNRSRSVVADEAQGSAIISILDDEPAQAPAAPSALSATPVSDTQVNLAWTDDSTNATGFVIEQRSDGSGQWTSVGTVPAGAVSYSVLSLEPGSTATYRVAAFNDVGQSVFSNEATATAAAVPDPSWLEHATVAAEGGRFKGWPANGGMWSWGDELVVLYTDTTFEESTLGHARAWEDRVNVEQARSRDGGRNWKIERDVITKPGAPGFPEDGNYGPEITDLQEPVDFEHPDFALYVQMANHDYGQSYWYYSYDRARTWNGPYRLPTFDYATVNARTDYIVDDSNELLLFLSGTNNTNTQTGSRPFVVRSTDGGITWKLLARFNAPTTVQTSTVRLSPTKLVSAARNNEVYVSNDNGATWTHRSTITHGGGSTPPRLTRLPDDRIVVTYGYRAPPYGVRAQISSDEGATWGREVVLRQDGGTPDLGYTRNALRPSGQIVTTYYYATDPSRERTIEATIWDPVEAFGPAP